MARRLLTCAAAMFFAGSSLAQTPSPQTPDASAEKVELADRLIVSMRPDSVGGAQLTEDAVRTAYIYRSQLAFFLAGGPAPPTGQEAETFTDFARLRQSLSAGVATIAPQVRTALGAIYARAFDANTLRAATAFYEDPAERAIVARRGEVERQADALAFSDKSGLSYAELTVQMDEVHRLVQAAADRTPAETAFAKTDAGRALAARAKQTESEARAAVQTLWPRAAEAASRDYCGARTCNDFEHSYFRHLAYLFDPEGFGSPGAFAGDFFARRADADLARAACTGDGAGVVAAIKAGADPNAVGKEGSGQSSAVRMTPLLWAIDCNNLAGMDALIEVGANPNLHGAYGETAVTVAASRPDPAALVLLLKHGGDPDARDDRRSALENALDYGSTAGWTALLDAKPNINQPSLGGYAIGDWAAIQHRYDAVADLLERGYTHNLAGVARALGIDADCGIEPKDQPGWLRVTTLMKARGFDIAPLYPCPYSVHPTP